LVVYSPRHYQPTMRVLTYLFLFISRMSFAQEIIPLYPNGVPGLLAQNIPEKREGANITNITQPTLAIYLPQNKTSDAAVVICPGGGYAVLAYKKEGEDLARWFNEQGMIAVVLKYRLPQEEFFSDAGIRPLQDAQRALAYVRGKAEEWKVKSVGIMGFSAGGHLAATASTLFDRPVGENPPSAVDVRPDFSLLIYPVVTMDSVYTHQGSRANLLGKHPSTELERRYSPEKQVNASTPPVFLLSTTDDWVQAENAIGYYLAAKKHKVPAELHVFEKGGHGYALTKANRGPIETWPELLQAWMREHKFLAQP
jgi:acetyl esterase/lipase